MKNNKLIQINRILAWPNALGYLLVHLIFDMKHGDPMDAMPLPAAIFFGVSSLWLLWHIWVGWKMFGWPKTFNSHGIFVVLSYSMIFTTIPIFSIPELGKNPFLMVLAWIPLLPHLAWNIWRLQMRLEYKLFQLTFVRISVTGVYILLILIGAVKSFPEF